jgi:hypothetical protein
MSPAEVGERARDDAEVGLRLRHLIERQRELHREEPPVAKVGTEGRVDPPDREGVTVVLGFPHQEQAVEELQPLVRPEQSRLDHLLVFDSRPAARVDDRLAHARTLTKRRKGWQCPHPETPGESTRKP